MEWRLSQLLAGWGCLDLKHHLGIAPRSTEPSSSPNLSHQKVVSTEERKRYLVGAEKPHHRHNLERCFQSKVHRSTLCD